MSAPLTLQSIPGLPTRRILLESRQVGLLFAPKAAGEPWEVWHLPEWIGEPYATEADALDALGIAAEQEARAA
jgi:hypothetical protein